MDVWSQIGQQGMHPQHLVSTDVGKKTWSLILTGRREWRAAYFVVGILRAAMEWPGSLEKREGMGRGRCLGQSLIDRYLESIYCVPGPVSGAEDKRAHKKDKSLCSWHVQSTGRRPMYLCFVSYFR